MLFVIGITITFFLEILLVSKKNKSESDIILAFWILFMGIHLLFFYLRYTKIIYSFPVLLGVDLPFPLFQGPFLLLYVMSLTKQKPRQRLWIYACFVPGFLSYLLFIPLFLLPPNERISIYENFGKGFETHLTINYIAIIILSMFFLIWSLILLNRHSKSIKNYFSDIERINLKWLKYLTYGLGSIYMVSFFFNEIYLYIVLVLFVVFIGFFGIKQVGIFSNVKVEPGNTNSNAAINATDRRRKYSKSGLSDDKAEVIYQQLVQLMTKDELYTTSELKLSDIATRLNIHSNYLSQIINERTSNNFYVFINNLRIEKFLKLINDPKNKNIKLIALAYDCGFNSKSSFNKYFKNRVGKTPTEYMNELRKSE